MKKFLFTSIVLLISQSTLAQLSPVLHDADGLPIGNAVGFGTTQGIEYVDVLSLKGYRAKMAYHTYLQPFPEGTDLPGFKALPFYESTDCSGDPVMLPILVSHSRFFLEYDFSNAWDFIESEKLTTYGEDKFQTGDMFEFEGSSYYVPLDTMLTSIETKSIFWGACQSIDRCAHLSWQDWGK